MRIVIQRVTHAKVQVDDRLVGEIGRGLLIFIAIGANDTADDARALASKIAALRVFDDEESKMNRSLVDIGGEALVVSEFTLYGDCRKGRRPNFVRAAAAEQARKLYFEFIEFLKGLGLKLATGEFQAKMKVELNNDGPVTLMLDTEGIL